MIRLSLSPRDQKQLIGTHSVLFTYYLIKKQWYSQGGHTSYIRAEQISRMNPPSAKAIIGKGEVRVQHDVQLFKQGEACYVEQLENPAMVQ
ncbi:MAG: hypothetical protein ACN4GF_06425 [Lentimonas sp.]